MKHFNKIPLLSMIATVSLSAQAGLQPIDDELMAVTTGQRGITVEISTGEDAISIGEVEYVDQGSVFVENITVDDINGLQVAIDVEESGTLKVVTEHAGAIKIGVGDHGGGENSAFKISGTEGTNVREAELVNNISLELSNLKSTVSIISTDNTTEVTKHKDAGFSDAAFSQPIAIRAESEFLIKNMNVGLFGYTDDQANQLGGTDDEKLALATDSGVQITGVTVHGGGNNSVNTAAKVDVILSANPSHHTAGGGIIAEVGEMDLSVSINDVAISGDSIGAINIRNINLTGMTTRIYGHN